MAQAEAGGARSHLNHEIVASLDDFQDPSQEWRRLFSELFGTFFLVLVAAGGGMMGEGLALQLGRVSREDIKTTAPVLHRHFVCFMWFRLLGPKCAPDVGRRRNRVASYFSFADECEIFTIRLDGKN